MTKDRSLDEMTESLISDMAQASDKGKKLEGALVEEPNTEDPTKEAFSKEVQETLKNTQQEVIGLTKASADPQAQNSWVAARELIERFQPVPWFIWRLSNFVLGKPGKIGKVNEGLVLGLRRLLFAAASDATLGKGEKINDMRAALKTLTSDSIAAISVIHAVSRKIGHSPSERIYRPLLDDAIVRAKIGYHVGKHSENFGAGRGMLAGFAGRAGLVIEVVSGATGQAKNALDELATGASIGEIGLKIYGCDPLQVSAMLLSACGCGKDSAFGVVRYSLGSQETANEEQQRWFSAFTVVESVRQQKIGNVTEEHWQRLSIDTRAKRDDLVDQTKKIVRRGHEWNWVV